MNCPKCGWPVYENMDGLRCCRNPSCIRGQIRQKVQDEEAAATLPWLVFTAASAAVLFILII